MMLFTRVLHPDAPRMCHRSSTGDNGARADAGSAHRNPGVSIMLRSHQILRHALLIRIHQRLTPSSPDRQCRPRHPANATFPIVRGATE